MFARFPLLKKPLLVLDLELAASSSSWGQAVQIDQKQNIDFTRYKTYNIMDESVRNDPTSKDIGANIFDLKRAVTYEMETRGYQRAAQPDLWVNIGIATKELVQTRQTVYQQDGPYYIGQRNYRWQAQNVPVGKYEEGTATIDVVDAARKEQVWQGTATRVLSRKPSRAAAQIDKGVAKAFERFPVKPR